MKNLLIVLMLMSPMGFAGDVETLTIGHSFDLDSQIMGEKRTVLVHLPRGYERNQESYPVLYMTDGYGHLQHTSGTVSFLAQNMQMPPMIVVAVTNTNRTRDLSPSVVEGRGETGGGETFLKFFTDELRPAIEKKYRTLPYRIFSGHSFGGAFAVNAFLTNPDSFDAFIAVAPSLQWDNQYLLKKAKTFFAKHKTMDKHLYVTLANEGGAMRESYDQFVEMLKQQKVANFTWGSKLMEDEDHGSVVLRSHYYGLKDIFAGWQMPAGLANIEDIDAHFKKISQQFKIKAKAPEARVNALGYRQLGNKEVEKAIATFAWNVKNYPKSANVYDSLGEALEAAGKLEKAYTNYKKAWKIGQKIKDPNAPIFKTNMERVAKLRNQS